MTHERISEEAHGELASFFTNETDLLLGDEIMDIVNGSNFVNDLNDVGLCDFDQMIESIMGPVEPNDLDKYLGLPNQQVLDRSPDYVNNCALALSDIFATPIIKGEKIYSNTKQVALSQSVGVGQTQNIPKPSQKISIPYDLEESFRPRYKSDYFAQNGKNRKPRYVADRIGNHFVTIKVPVGVRGYIRVAWLTIPDKSGNQYYMPYKFQQSNVSIQEQDVNPLYVPIAADSHGYMRLYLVLIKSTQGELKSISSLEPFQPFRNLFGALDEKKTEQKLALTPKQLIHMYQLDQSQLAFTFCSISPDGKQTIHEWDTTVYSTVLTELPPENSKRKIITCPRCTHEFPLQINGDDDGTPKKVTKKRKIITKFSINRKKMTVETDTIKNPKESPTKTKRKRASRSSSSGSSSSGTTSSSSASSRSSSSSSSNSSSSTSRSSSAASSPEKKGDRNKVNNNKSSNKKPSEHDIIDEKKPAQSTNSTRRSPSPSSRRQEKEATKIYIGKLSLNVNKEHLAEIFGTFGEIKEIDLPSHRIYTHLHRGFAHIEYVTANGAEQACKYMEGGQVDGKEIVCVLVHGQPPHLSSDRNRRERSPYHGRRRRSPLPPSRHYPPQRRMGDRDRDRGRYNDRRGGYSPPSRNYRRGQSPPTSSRRTGAGGNAAESPKKKERRYSRSSSSESK
ncbi:unnamed protein product [Adineta steineri]|uniref:RRM domain-containing protein n=1 Tax=Adineta steineri TaxID=433720 RepID=A0A819AN70_9BILA|nr:unnamed protein product [Adineta steineri]